MTPSQAERTESTRAALIDAARELFAARGYAAVPAEEIVRAAGVTRGALYHHFRDKKDLFRAVHEGLEAALVERIGRTLEGAGGGGNALDLLVAGMDAFLDACEEPVFARIALQEAPSVLGWAEWREIDMRYSLGLVTGVLRHAMDSGDLRDQSVEALGHILVGAMGEAGLLIASGTPRAEVRPPLLTLLEGLKA